MNALTWIAALTGLGVVITLFIGLAVPQLPSLKQLLVGAKVPPAIVGPLRLVFSAFGGVLLTMITDYLTTWQGSTLAAAGIALTGLVNVCWSALDQWLKHGQNDVNPGPVAGGGPKDLLED